MPFNSQRAHPLLQAGELTRLFVEELGWEPCRQKLVLRVGETDYALTAIAEKRGFIAWRCASPDGGLPDHNTRLKLDRALAQTSFEHLIVFVTADLQRQSWVWVRREPGRPLAVKTHDFTRGQPGDSLLDKLQLLYVSLEEEEAGLSITQIAARARAAFDIERVTKAFYREFDTHRKAFLKSIAGIEEAADREWYASVMLNRLMFVYFIQRKGFLDGDPHYLRNRLKRCQQEQGKNKFYSFYRYFLLRLFHEGFGKRRKDRAPDLEKLLGAIPYLNGGLFDVHELERPDRYGQNIQIPDKAFARIFNYFDQYQWHLDDRPLRADNEINPDVLGYIFEKYINQKQMGAYYTREDITEYISKSTVIPFLFDAARAKCKVAFDNSDGPTVWDLLREHPDRYIYPAVRHGTDKKLPPAIAAGLDTQKPNLIQRRQAWNQPAPGEFALPTEIWREVVSRRQRYWELWSRLSGRPAQPEWAAHPPAPAALRSSSLPVHNPAPEKPPAPVSSINDFITLNLDLRQFAQDVISNCEGPDLLMAFWQAITGITILDPTGGSGAFIFAALNILEPLYEACLDRMEAFRAEWDAAGGKSHPNYHKKFTELHDRVKAHPNRRYFVLKSIILNNLYAVDIMAEAVEICKLRLFLKLAAQVKPNPAADNLGIEPLPDIDFNIRAGNTLVGYATKQEVQRCMKEVGGGQMKLMDEADLGSFARFNTRCADVEQAFAKFRQLQTEGDGSVPHADKLELQRRLKMLEQELNRHLAGEYRVKASDKTAYAAWLKSHQPFHWFIQFYGILARGGFDVIIGNPPYVEYVKVKDGYTVPEAVYSCLPCGNLYALVLERCFGMVTKGGRIGMIVQLSAVCTDRMQPLQAAYLKSASTIHASCYDDRPGKLFDGLEHIRATILISQHTPNTPSVVATTNLLRWYSEYREGLFPLLQYGDVTKNCIPGSFPKLGQPNLQVIVAKTRASQKTLEWLHRLGAPNAVYYYRSPLYWIRSMDFLPHFDSADASRSVHHFKDFGLQDKRFAPVVGCLINSTLFYIWFIAYGNGRNVALRDITTFPAPAGLFTEESADAFRKLFSRLMADFKKHSALRKRSDGVEFQEFYPSKSKPILDEIDTLLAKHYGFNAQELDFILNYDIKYRLGRDAGGGG